jgi:hypothetical protein
MLLQEPQKLFSETPQQHEDESDQEERPEGVEITLVTCQQPSEAAKPSEGSLHLPTLRVTRTGLHGPTSFRGFSWAPLVGGDSGFDSPTAQPAPEVLTVVGLVGDQLLRSLLRTPSSCARDPHGFERGHGQFHLVVSCARQFEAYGKALSISDQHHLGALATLGLANRSSPFFAGTKLPSKNALVHFSCPRLSSMVSKLRQTFSQVPSSPHALSLRQQVAGEPYSRGTSSQRHPVRSTYRIPLRVLRSSALGRPRGRRGGSSGSRSCHCSSVSSVALISGTIVRPYGF